MATLHHGKRPAQAAKSHSAENRDPAGVQCVPLRRVASTGHVRVHAIFSLRHAESRDFEDVRRLAEDSTRLPEASAVSPGRLRFVLAARSRFARTLADASEFWRVAVSDGSVVGWVHAGVREDGGVTGPPFTEIVMLFVSEAHRRHGIASALMGLVEAASRLEGIGLLRLVVHDSNLRARSLYATLGFLAHQGFMEKQLVP